jgi:hypothetical protein
MLVYKVRVQMNVQGVAGMARDPFAERPQLIHRRHLQVPK